MNMDRLDIEALAKAIADLRDVAEKDRLFEEKLRATIHDEIRKQSALDAAMDKPLEPAEFMKHFAVRFAELKLTPRELCAIELLAFGLQMGAAPPSLFTLLGQAFEASQHIGWRR